MEPQGNNKMPKFSMSWIYALVIIGLLVMYMMGGDAVGGSANKKVSYTDFRAYVLKGYAAKVVINKDESTLKMFVKPEHIRDVFHAGTQQTGKEPYLNVEFGDVGQVQTFLDTAQKAGKFSGALDFENNKGNLFTSLLYSLGPILFFFLIWMFLMRRMGGGMGDPHSV